MQRHSGIGISLVIIMLTFSAYSEVKIAGNTLVGLPTFTCDNWQRPAQDWLIDPTPFKAQIYASSDNREIIISNGLISRHFCIVPNAATTAIDNLMTGESQLRSIRPETMVKIDGITYAVGGLTGQPIHNYVLSQWIEEMKSDSHSFQYVNFSIGEIKERFPWKRMFGADAAWPPPGITLTLEYSALINSPAHHMILDVHYEIYDGIPLISKWFSLRNVSNETRQLDTFTSEILAVVEAESSVETNPQWRLPNMHVETDYAFGGMDTKGTSGTVRWLPDTLYTTQVNYDLKTPCLLECRPPIGPAVAIKPGETFESFRTFELYFDSTDRERQGLAQRKMYRAIAPWVTENPLLFHAASADPDYLRRAIDQCADVGFELVIMTFGSGFDFENRDAAYMDTYKQLSEFARNRGVGLGGYSLLASRSAADKADNCAGPCKYGVMPCLGAKWGIAYLAQLKMFIDRSGLGVLEHDGSYPGDPCASTEHPGHRGLEDSQWVQWRAITDFYKWCRAHGVYLNVPDWYYLSGSSKCAMGYRETNWSLPRAQQEIIERQNIYDGTWEKIPSMGWMFVPLMEYHGGGTAATIEPLEEHLDHYAQRLANLFGAGVQACFRGPRLYDTDRTRTVVAQWVNWYKRHRAILDSDIIHIRRPDGRDYDAILHVNPLLKEKGLLMVYNPLDHAITGTLDVPLYYTGLRETAMIQEKDNAPGRYKLDRNFHVAVPVSIAAHSQTWFVIE